MDMTQFGITTNGPTNFPTRYLLEFTITGAGTCKFSLYVMSVAGLWGIPIDPNGNLGAVAGDDALPADTYFMILEDVGLFPRISIVQHDNSGGTPVTVATLTALAEKVELQ